MGRLLCIDAEHGEARVGEGEHHRGTEAVVHHQLQHALAGLTVLRVQ